jgi:hypothetical protein
MRRAAADDGTKLLLAGDVDFDELPECAPVVAATCAAFWP